MEDSKKPWYKRPTIILQIISIFIGMVILVWSIPRPYLEVGTFPYKIDHFELRLSASGSVYSNDSLPNTSLPSQSVDPTSSSMIFNITFQVVNSGKGTAHNVKVSIRGEPPEGLKVNSGYVYVGAPLENNLLETIKDEYEIGLIETGKSYTFTFVLESRTTGKYIFTVTSDDAFTNIYTLFVD